MTAWCILFLITVCCRKLDLIVGGFARNSMVAKYFLTSISYIQDDLTWCVRRAETLPVFLNIFRLTDLYVWFSYFGLIFLTGILLFIYVKFDPHIMHLNKNIYYMILLIAAPASGGFAVNRRMLPHRSLFRLYMVIILLASYVGLVTWSSFLSVTMLHTYRLDQVADIDELIEQNFDLSSSPASYTIIYDQKKVMISFNFFFY